MSDNTAIAEAKEKEGAGGKTRSSRKKSSPTDPSLNMDELRELAELVNEHGFTDFEFENENIRVRLSKMTAPALVQTVQPAAVATASTPSVQQTVSEEPAEVEEDLYKITSPIVGTFYRSPGPDKEPYVKEGTQVTPESVVCIVEAMKLMNEIQAETTGEIVKIYVENGQPVEFGQPLFGIKK
jgi:acetyl-CoA carboxylase biotin carboxyl carrier protein